MDQRQHLVIMRHGRRLDSVYPEHRIHSKTPWDSPLAPHGIQECAQKARQFEGLSFSLVMISPFTRCLQTAAAMLPHLTLEKGAQIFIHRGLSELFQPQYLFFPQSAGWMQRAAFWWWQYCRSRVDPEYSVMGNTPVERKVLGSWPSVPESVEQANARYEAVIQEALLLTAGTEGNILIVSHAQAVEHSLSRLGVGRVPDVITFLGHTIASRPRPGRPTDGTRDPPGGTVSFAARGSSTAGAKKLDESITFRDINTLTPQSDDWVMHADATGLSGVVVDLHQLGGVKAGGGGSREGGKLILRICEDESGSCAVGSSGSAWQ